MNRGELLHATDHGRAVVQHYLGIEPKAGRNIQNPLQAEKQKTPSFNLYPDETGEWRFNDFATGDKGSWLDLVMTMHRLTMPEAMAHIERELGLSAGATGAPRPVFKRPAQAAPKKLARCFEPVYRATPTDDELSFWRQSGIGPDVLDRYGVRALESYTATRVDGATTYTVRATITNPLFAYDAGDGFFKVYAPLAEKKYKFTWPTGQPDGYVFGLTQLAEWQPLILLAAGEKDAMTLSAHGYAAVTVGSEAAPVSAGLIAELSGRCDEVLMCYDADDTGRRRAAEIAAQHGLRWVELPAELTPYGKDATDLFRAVYAGELSSTLLNDAINSAHKPSEKPEAATAGRTSATRLRTMQQRVEEARNAPPLLPLLGCLWERPGLVIGAGEPGAGKSLLGVHIAHAVSSTTPTLLGLTCDTNEKVLYYDFELTDRQLEKRFPDFQFTENLIAGDFNPEALDVEFTFKQIEADLDQTGAKLLIIDNITALALKTTADADASIAVMRGLKRLQVERGVSSLVLAHPPKVPPGVPLSLNHVGGSKHITNFADSVFFIARSEQGPNTRYIKQVKNRTGEMLPGVLVCEITPLSGHLGFTLVGPDEERSHLAQVEEAGGKPEGESAADIAKLRALWLLNPSATQASLAAQCERSVGWVNKHLKAFKAEQTEVHIHAEPGAVNA